MSIAVKQTASGEPMEFEVEVQQGRTRTRHRVTLDAATFERLARGGSAVDLVRGAFEFLLERESAQSILSTFDLTVISRYFPEFEREIGRYQKKR